MTLPSTVSAPRERNTEPIEVVHVGLGPIGRQIVTFLADRSQFRSVGAVDIDPALVGRMLNDAMESAVIADEVRITGAVADLGPVRPGAVAVHCAGSSLRAVAPSLLSLIDAGFHVVSTCEELSNPWETQRELATKLDAAARSRNVVVLGTGVNPGYAMDYLPVVLAASQRSVRGVGVHRIQDAGQRRVPLQQKVGAGLTVAEFADRVGQGTIRHVGLPESARIVDRALALGCTGFVETIDPISSEAPVALGRDVIEPGRVLGIDQLVVGTRDDAVVVRLHLQMAVGLEDPRDVVTIDGEPGLESVIRGLHGDSATAAVVVNALGRVQVTPPGLRTVDELPASPLCL